MLYINDESFMAKCPCSKCQKWIYVVTKNSRSDPGIYVYEKILPHFVHQIKTPCLTAGFFCVECGKKLASDAHELEEKIKGGTRVVSVKKKPRPIRKGVKKCCDL